MVLKVENHDYLAKKTEWWLARQANIVGVDKMLEIVVYCAKNRQKNDESNVYLRTVVDAGRVRQPGCAGIGRRAVFLMSRKNTKSTKTTENMR